jgi:hypothetical protein
VPGSIAASTNRSTGVQRTAVEIRYVREPGMDAFHPCAPLPEFTTCCSHTRPATGRPTRIIPPKRSSGVKRGRVSSVTQRAKPPASIMLPNIRRHLSRLRVIPQKKSQEDMNTLASCLRTLAGTDAEQAAPKQATRQVEVKTRRFCSPGTVDAIEAPPISRAALCHEWLTHERKVRLLTSQHQRKHKQLHVIHHFAPQAPS